MFCSKCGKDLPDTAKFCDGCGNSVKKVERNYPIQKEDDSNIKIVEGARKEEKVSTTIKEENKSKGTGKIFVIIIATLVVALLICLADGCLIHEWRDATCTEPQRCSICYTVGEPAKEHQLDSSGKCTVCNQQVGVALTMSNYKEYIKAFLDKTENYTGVTYYELQFTPKKSVKFYNVKITAEIIYDVETTNYYRSLNGKTGILLQNGKYRHKLSTSTTETIQINEQGYGLYGDYTAVQDGNGNEMDASFPNVSANVKKITGYVVEN